MGAMTSQIFSLTIVYATVYSGADQRKHQSSASLAFVRGIHRGLANSPHKGPVTREMFAFDDVIMDVQTKWRDQLDRTHRNKYVTNQERNHYVKTTSETSLWFNYYAIDMLFSLDDALVTSYVSMYLHLCELQPVCYYEQGYHH